MYITYLPYVHRTRKKKYLHLNMNDMFCAVRCGQINIHACVKMRSVEFLTAYREIDMFTRAVAHVRVMCYFGISAAIKYERYASEQRTSILHNIDSIYTI